MTRGQASGCGSCCWRGDGDHTLEELAGLLGRSRSTLQLGLEKFRAGGVSRLLERGASPGVGSLINAQTVKAELTAGLAAGRWRAASEVAAWLDAAHGIKRAQVGLFLAQSPSERAAGIGEDQPEAAVEAASFGRVLASSSAVSIAAVVGLRQSPVRLYSLRSKLYLASRSPKAGMSSA